MSKPTPSDLCNTAPIDLERAVEAVKPRVSQSVPNHRPLSHIAREIHKDWARLSPYAGPYLDAMFSLDQITDQYHADSAQSVVLYFLSNASTWRGDTAKRVKAELKSILRSNGYKI